MPENGGLHCKIGGQLLRVLGYPCHLFRGIGPKAHNPLAIPHAHHAHFLCTHGLCTYPVNASMLLPYVQYVRKPALQGSASGCCRFAPYIMNTKANDNDSISLQGSASGAVALQQAKEKPLEWGLL